MDKEINIVLKEEGEQKEKEIGEAKCNCFIHRLHKLMIRVSLNALIYAVTVSYFYSFRLLFF